jgi:hypothetical protein
MTAVIEGSVFLLISMKVGDEHKEFEKNYTKPEYFWRTLILEDFDTGVNVPSDL